MGTSVNEPAIIPADTPVLLASDPAADHGPPPRRPHSTCVLPAPPAVALRLRLQDCIEHDDQNGAELLIVRGEILPAVRVVQGDIVPRGGLVEVVGDDAAREHAEARGRRDVGQAAARQAVQAVVQVGGGVQVVPGGG